MIIKEEEGNIKLIESSGLKGVCDFPWVNFAMRSCYNFYDRFLYILIYIYIYIYCLIFS